MTVNKWKKQLVSFGISLLTGLILCSALLLIFAMVMKGREVSPLLLQPMAFVPTGIGSLLGALICARKIGEKGLLYGAVCGLLMFMIFLLVSVAFTGLPLGYGALIKCAICVLCGCIGGVLGVNMGKRVRI